jgi:hypothetical protein
MTPVNTSGLEIVFRNSHPRRQSLYPKKWLLVRRDFRVRIYVSRDSASRPSIIKKEAA